MSARTVSLALFTVGALAGAASAQLTAWGITTNERLVSFDTNAPGALLSNVAISGLNSTEKVYGIDARPASVTGALVIVTSENRLMSLGFDGVATPIGSGFTPGLSTTSFGFDFNPTVDRVRVMNSDTVNRRLNPVTGAAVATDTALTYSDTGTPFVVGTAYNSFQFGAGAPLGSVRQFVVDARRDILAEAGSQAGGNASFNAGVLTPIGSLGIDLAEDAGFDIFGPTQTAFISSFGGGANVARFYSVNLSTGAATLIGDIGDGATVVDFAVIPTPGAASLLGLGTLAGLRRRR